MTVAVKNFYVLTMSTTMYLEENSGMKSISM